MIKLTKNSFDQFHTYLFDAAGVVYTDGGIVNNVQAVIKACQERANFFLVTNNSYMYPTYITERLAQSNIHIPEKNIISSGAVKYNKGISSLLKNKTIYLLGEHTSEPYFIEAGCKKITKNLAESDIIMLAAFLNHYSDSLIDDIIQHAKENPNIAIICCNPDRYVVGKTGLHPVVGLYAEKIEKAINRPITWFGKPFSNFSEVVEIVMKENNIVVDDGICFFDDNVENVVNMGKHIGISACWVKETGIGHYLDTTEVINRVGQPRYFVESIEKFV